ncbi:hypothetical protein Gpo141_00013781 [Globisporangium polare]
MAAETPQAVSVDFTELQDGAAASPPPAPAPLCSKNGQPVRRTELLVVTTVHATPNTQPCVECGVAHYEKTIEESVSSLPVVAQNALRARIWLVCSVFLAVAALATQLLLAFASDGLRDHDQMTVLVSLAGVCVLVIQINVYESPRTPWLLVILLGFAQAGILAVIDRANAYHVMFVICCVMGVNFLCVAAYLQLASKRSAEDESPELLSPVCPSLVAYLLSAVIQIVVYWTTNDATAFVTRNELITCLVVELLLVAYMLWDLSQLWRVMTQDEVPRVLGSLYVNMLAVGFFFVMLAVLVAAAVLACVFNCLWACVTCKRVETDSDKAVEEGRSGSGDTAAAGEPKAIKSLTVTVGDAFYKKMRGA